MEFAQIVQWIADMLLQFLHEVGYWGVFLAMFIESSCLPISSEVVLLFSGFLVWQDKFSLVGMAMSSAAGFMLGALVPYGLGRKYGRQFLTRWGGFLFTSEREMDRVDRWFSRHGEKTILLTRFVPVLRDFISFPAGYSGMPVWRFMLYTYVGIIPWTLFVVYVGSALGAHWQKVIGAFAAGNSVVLWVLAAIVVALILRRVYAHFRPGQ